MATVGTGVESPSDTTTKLRDSCQACSISKVKCPKEKPTCSRCQSRSISCQYIFTRRPGRRRQVNRQPNDGRNTKPSSGFGAQHCPHVEWNTVQALQSSAGACLLSPSTTPCGSNNDYIDTSPQSLSIPTSPRPDPFFATEEPNDISGLGEISMSFPSFEDFSCEGNDMDFIMSAMESPFGMPTLDNGGIPQTHNDIESLLISPQGINVDLQPADVSSAACSLSVPSKVATSVSDIQVLANARFEVTRLTDTTSCGCLTQSLDLLKTLSAQADLQPYISGSEPQGVSDNPTYDSLHSVLTENKDFIGAVSERLACPCSAGDDFLLAVLSMTVMKILERYAAVAREQQPSGANAGDPGAERSFRLANNTILAGSKDQTKAVGRTHDAPRNRERRAAQLVLGELHRVQRLVNELSPKLKRCKGEAQRTGPDPGPRGYQSMAPCWDRGPAAPFSATTLDQMESDVRKSLGALSSEMINGLRQS